MKILDDPIKVDSLDIPHYNKNQLIEYACTSCKKDILIKYSNFIKKTSLLCKSCLIKSSDYKSRGLKISQAKRQNPITHEKAVAAQVNRTDEAKKATIEKFRKTMSDKDLSEMKQKMRDAKASMTDEERQLRIERFQESYYKSQKDRIIQHAYTLLDNRNIKYSNTDFLFQCECTVCSTKWEWSPIKKYNCYTQVPYCPKCFASNRSSYEIAICKMLDSLGVEYITNDRDILNGKELDIYVPEFRIAIEFDGIYCSKKTYEKYLALQKQDIQLLNIFESEYDENKIRGILTSKFRKSDIVYARKCSVVELDNESYRAFCEKTHIQGYAPAKVRYGLMYNGELIQVMSFSKPRFNKKCQWEIIRECSTKGVVDGKDRLFKHFIKLNDPQSIISYCDKRYFSGESYLRLGMKEQADSPMGYVYTNGKETLSRVQCQKHKLSKLLNNFNPEMSEYENMILNGYFRLYDFGQKVFIWRKE